ncbi:hypothetical protein IJ818_03605 [bacterium]|nr:hypothetical protein [bacterium]
MALFWDKPVLSLVKTYNDWFKDGQGIEDLEKVLNQPKKNKNNILYWYLTHYIIFEKDFYKEDFLYNYLKEKFEEYKNEGITFEFFNKVNDIDDITKYTINFIKDYYVNIRKEKLKKCIENIKQIFVKSLKKIKFLVYAIIKISKIYVRII